MTNQRLVEAQRIKNIAKQSQPRRVLLIANFRSSYRSTYERNIRYFSVNDIPLFVLRWGTRYYLYSVRRDLGGVINESK